MPGIVITLPAIAVMNPAPAFNLNYFIGIINFWGAPFNSGV